MAEIPGFCGFSTMFNYVLLRGSEWFQNHFIKELIATSEEKSLKGDTRDGEMSLIANKHKRRKQLVTFHFEEVVKKYSNSISLIFTRELRHVF